MSRDDSFLPPQWESIAPQLDRLLEADPGGRAQLLAEITGEDAERRRVLEQLLAECERDMPLLDGLASDRLADLARAGDSLDVEPPTMLGGRYRIGDELGQGGMARVFRAEDIRHGRSVAVKVIRPELSASLGRGRFLREIEMVARLRHPNIMPLFDSGEDDGVLYYVMPLEAGASLKARLAHGAPLSLTERLSILRDVARAIAHAHAEGVVHRDIKPANVMLSGGAAVVADFGIGKAITVARDAGADAHVTSEGAIIGTPAYMAPEQAAGDPGVDHRADLYSFGCLAYEVLTGFPPFRGTAPEILAGHLGTPPPSLAALRADLSPSVVRIVDQCLRKAPAERPASAREVLDVLEAPIMAPARRLRFPRATLGVAGAVLVLAVGVWRVNAGAVVASGQASTSLSPVVLLPFRNAERDTALDYMASALPSHVAEQLGAPPDVLPFIATRDLEAARDSARRERLGSAGVRSIVEGEVHRVGDSVASDVRVVDVTTGERRFHVRVSAGSRQFAELVRLLTDSLRARLALPPPPVGPPETKVSEAWRLVSEAEYLARLDPSDARVQALYSSASSLDPGWYRPFIGLSDYMGIAIVAQAGTRMDSSRASMAEYYGQLALTHAVASPAALAAARIRLALPRFLLGKVAESMSDAHIAASLDSTDYHTQSLIGAWFKWSGQLDSAWKYKARSQRLAPWNAAELVGLAALQRCAGNRHEELELLTRAVDLLPNRERLVWLAEALAAAGRFDDAVAALERATPDEIRALRARAGTKNGIAQWRLIREHQARARLARLNAQGASPRRLMMEWIEAFEGTGQRDSATAVLAEWITSGAPKLSLQRFCIHPLDAFRRDTRVQALVRASSWPLAEFDTVRMRELAPTLR
ncbi:MAG: protein kinase [Gemmatimonadetes bacterium]|nr:protein kinase [Gemmatimonadota bacterium]